MFLYIARKCITVYYSMLTTIEQGDFMKLPNIFNPIASILSVKAIGSVVDVSEDLALPDGDSIENLIKANEKTESENKNQSEE